MNCPRCGSSNTSVVSHANRQGFGVCNGLLGLICFGPIGLLCGLIGMNQINSVDALIVCGNCGTKTRF